jgi:hypothetical protein
MPYEHLLRSLDAGAGVISAIYRDLGSCDRSSRSGTGDVALVALHVNVRDAAAVWDPEPCAGAAPRWAGRHCGRDGVCGDAFPWSTVDLLIFLKKRIVGCMDILLKHREYCEVLHRDSRYVRLVTNGECRASGHGLVLHMHRTVVLDTTFAIQGVATPVFGMLLPIGPLRSKFASKGQCSLSTIVCELDCEIPAGWKFQELTLWRGDHITSLIVLKPPLILGHHIQRVDSGVGVAVVDSGHVAALAIHAVCPSCHVRFSCSRQGYSEEEGGMHDDAKRMNKAKTSEWTNARVLIEERMDESFESKVLSKLPPWDLPTF